VVEQVPRPVGRSTEIRAVAGTPAVSAAPAAAAQNQRRSTAFPFGAADRTNDGTPSKRRLLHEGVLCIIEFSLIHWSETMTRLPLFAAAALALAFPAAAKAGPVTVDLTGLRAGGTLYVQVQTRAQFMGATRVGGRIVAAPSAGSLGVDLGEIPPGDYAVTVWHDTNGNNRFDMGTDGWAMANGDRLRGQPTFEIVKLTIPADALRLPLALSYGF
jgi:uncharacterized protein (DUF2141 family)